LGALIWDRAQHADALGKRTYELRLPLQFSQAPVSAYGELLREMAGITDTRQRIAAMYEVMLPALTARFRSYVARTDTLLDAPTVRIVERIIADQTRMMREGQELLKEAAAPELGDAAGTRGGAGGEAAVEPIVEPRLREPVVASAS